MNLTKKVGLSWMVISLIFAFSALAADIPPELAPLAKELGCQTTTECALKFDANIENGIALAQKYDIYTPEQEKVATTYKTEVLERLRGVSQDNFEEEILALANKILSEKPALAKTMGVTRERVNVAQTVINTVRDAGVDIRTCQKSPEDLSREQLIACVKAGNDLSSKGTLVGDYIPKGNVKAKEVERMLDLENSLLAGEYSGLGRVNAEQAGQICLKPGSESISDCDRIAQKFFGADGVKHLEEARQQTTRIKEYYTEGIGRMELVMPDGQKLIGKGAIRNACDKAFEESNLGLARACGNFAVKNGYATETEVSEGLKLLETFTQKSEGVNFDDCRFNPESCREFLPDEFRSQFDSQFEIFRIMSESIGFDPVRCENTYDPDISKRCLEGAKAALGRVEEIAKNSPEARRIVDEIKSHVAEGERMSGKLDEFHQDSDRGGMAGPGGCRGPEECFKYCSQAVNSAECISFGAKSQIFDQNTAAQKFNMVNEGLNTRDVDPGFNRYPYPERPAGPSPECFAAIESGDFVKAKTACSETTSNYRQPIAEPFPMCPTVMPSPCPEGQMRQMASDERNCPTYGVCVVVEGYKPADPNIRSCSSDQYWDGKNCVVYPKKDIPNTCPMMPTVDSCPAGQEKYETYSSPECGKYYSCKSSTTPITPDCPGANQYRDPEKNICITQTPCPSPQYWDYMTDACATPTPTKECPLPTWWDPATQSCKSSPVSYGCGSMITQASCQTSPGCGWANGACGGNMNTSSSCPSGQYWYTPPGGGAGYCMSSASSGSCPSGYHSHGESGGFCMNDQENYSGTCYNSAGTATMTCPQTTYTSSCTSGQYWNGTACVSSFTTGQCPSGQYWYTPQGGGTGYCMSSSGSACTSGQYWNGTACVSSSTTTPSSTTCSSGQYWNGSACVSSTTSGTSCSSGQWWNGTACQDITYPTPSYPTPSYMTPPTESYPTPSYMTPPTESYPTPSYPTPPTSMVLCDQSDGNWTGAACNLAKNISDQKAYSSYYQKQSSPLVAQALRAFLDLFR